LIELLSYVLSFHNVMIGPCIFYKDYYDFITGKNIGLGKAKYKVCVCVLLTSSVTMRLHVSCVVWENVILKNSKCD